MPPDAPTPAAAVRATVSSAAPRVDARAKRSPKAAATIACGALLPTEADERKSRTVGRYQFRREGAGWECRETVGKGAERKRIYLAHLSRAGYEEMQARAATAAELETELIKWVESKKNEKQGE